ncbi:glycerophosphodiester phosphodiesterase family protein [uncultured Roseobacter sp.]|uniref:glycerophosphodiester phosphodiesterase family protein n=1 Tax=uncultured Roseobacter sp. TaxID=114847 RepID=UPI002631D3AE|nr:glycerophosphodiester phosphodiesterase family protein [uncultured Roseobacter sp.]
MEGKAAATDPQGAGSTPGTVEYSVERLDNDRDFRIAASIPSEGEAATLLDTTAPEAAEDRVVLRSGLNDAHEITFSVSEDGGATWFALRAETEVREDGDTTVTTYHEIDVITGARKTALFAITAKEIPFDQAVPEFPDVTTVPPEPPLDTSNDAAFGITRTPEGLPLVAKEDAITVNAVVRIEEGDPISLKAWDPVKGAWVEVYRSEAGAPEVQVQRELTWVKHGPDHAHPDFAPRLHLTNLETGEGISDRDRDRTTRTLEGGYKIGFEANYDPSLGTLNTFYPVGPGNDFNDVTVRFDPPVEQVALDNDITRNNRVASVTLTSDSPYGFDRFEIQNAEGDWVTVSTVGGLFDKGKHWTNQTVEFTYGGLDPLPKMRFVTSAGDIVMLEADEANGRIHDWVSHDGNGFSARVDLPDEVTEGRNATQVELRTTELPDQDTAPIRDGYYFTMSYGDTGRDDNDAWAVEYQSEDGAWIRGDTLHKFQPGGFVPAQIDETGVRTPPVFRFVNTRTGQTHQPDGAEIAKTPRSVLRLQNAEGNTERDRFNGGLEQTAFVIRKDRMWTSIGTTRSPGAQGLGAHGGDDERVNLPGEGLFGNQPLSPDKAQDQGYIKISMTGYNFYPKNNGEAPVKPTSTEMVEPKISELLSSVFSGADEITGSEFIDRLSETGYKIDFATSGIDNDLAPYVIDGLGRGQLDLSTAEDLFNAESRGVLNVDHDTKTVTLNRGEINITDGYYIMAAVIVADLGSEKQSEVLERFGFSLQTQELVAKELGDGDSEIELSDFDQPLSNTTLPVQGLQLRIGRRSAAVIAVIGAALVGYRFIREVGVSEEVGLFSPNLGPNDQVLPGKSGIPFESQPQTSETLVSAVLGHRVSEPDLDTLIDMGVLEEVGTDGRSPVYRTNFANLTPQQENALVANIFDGYSLLPGDEPKDVLLALGFGVEDLARLRSIHLKTDAPITGDLIRSLGNKNAFAIDVEAGVSVVGDQAYDEVGRSPKAVRPEDTSWPAVQEEPEVPPGFTKSDVYGRYTTPKLLTNWKKGDGPEIIPHRGEFSNGLSIPENSIASLKEALGDGNHHAVEIDVLQTKDNQLVLSHDLATHRVTARDRENGPGNKLVSDLTANEIVGERIVIREVEGNHFTGRYIATDQVITTLDTALEAAVSVDPDSTVFIDAKEDAGALAVAQLSHRPALRDRAIVKFYPYQYKSVAEFITTVEKYNPAAGWQENVAIIPIVVGDAVEDLAKEKYGVSDPSVNQRFAVASEWVDGFTDAGLRVVAREIPVFTTGKFYNPETDTAAIDGRAITDPTATNTYKRDFVSMRLVDHYRRTDPSRPIMGSYRADDYRDINGNYYYYNIVDGKPQIKSGEDRFKESELRSTPGQLSDWADWFISDRPLAEKVFLVDQGDSIDDIKEERENPVLSLEDNGSQVT